MRIILRQFFAVTFFAILFIAAPLETKATEYTGWCGNCWPDGECAGIGDECQY